MKILCKIIYDIKLRWKLQYYVIIYFVFCLLCHVLRKFFILYSIVLQIQHKT